MSTRKLVLIDGHALAYRFFFGLPLASFTTKEGEPTNATFGFARQLMEIILSSDPPEYLAVSFDVGATFRDEIFAEYKGTREKMPDELRVQMERIREVVAAFNVPILELEGFEADDVLGTVARQSVAQGVDAHIITGDRDLLQLVDDETSVELPAGRGSQPNKVYRTADVVDYFGIRPDQVVDWKALVGDSSDNIPGVRGIGQKTATKLLLEYETLDGVYEHLAEIKGANQTKLADGRESAYLSQKLARIITDAPITLDLPACQTRDFEPEAVLEIFRTLEFRSLTRQLLDAVEMTAEDTELELDLPAATEVVLVNSAPALAALVKGLQGAKAIAFDVETTGLDKMTAQLVGISVAVAPPVGYYIPVGHIDSALQSGSGQMKLFAGDARLAGDQLPLDTVLAALRPALTDPGIPKIAHNAKYDYTILLRQGLEVTPIGGDTMIAEWLTDPASKFKGLKELANHRLGVRMQEITTLIGSGRSQKSFAEVPIEEAAPYAAADADLTLRLFRVLKPEVKKLGLANLEAMELRLIPILADMEMTGVGVDVAFLAQMSTELESRLAALEAQIHEIAGEAFNINSTQQLSEILFKKLDLPHERLKRTSSGFYSTASGVLENLKPSDSTGMINAVLEYRELGKLKSTYVDALPTMVNETTGRIHTSFNQTGTVTGRIASNSPNLQNIPIRTEAGQQIRRAFVARPGWQFVAADYSQVELRILAHISQDEALLSAFRNDLDIHRATAATVYGIDLAAVTYNQRRFAKAVNFGLIYGMGPYRLARDSDLTLAEAENFIKTYFERFPGIQTYLESTRLKARTDGYVETLLGRRRMFPIFGSAAGRANQQAAARAEREAVNHPIQGTAADIVKLAMIQLYEALTERFRAKMILQVHDELVFEAPDEEVDAVRDLALELMSQAFTLDIPLKVEASVGRNWLALKD